MQVVRNVKKMFERGDGHVHVLAASLRNVDHLLYSFWLGVELATAPAKILEQWAASKFPVAGENFLYAALDANQRPLTPISYKELDLNASGESFDLKHELTDKGIKKFVEDYKSTLAPAA